MKVKETIDFLTYRSWWYQVNWYGVSVEKARKLFTDWEKFEEVYKDEKKD